MRSTHTVTSIPAAAALGLALLSMGCGREAPTAAPAQQPPPPEVAVHTVEPQSVTITTELPGRVSAFLVAEVRPQVGGIIQERLFTEGSDVKAGHVLYRIDPSTYRAAHANAKAALARAKANHVSAKASRGKAATALAGARAAQTRATTALASAKAALSRAEANAVPLRLKAERFKELLSINAVSRQDYDDASAAVEQAEAAIEGARAAVEGAEAEIQEAEAAVEGARAAIEVAEAAIRVAAAEIEGAAAALETARINLDHTRVTAPISGRIGRSSVTTGALVTANQPAALATIQQLDSVYVDVTQTVANLLRLRQSFATGELKTGGPNQAKVKLILENGSPYPAEGTLKFSDVTVDPSTGSVTLRTVFPNPKQLLLPGMYVRAVLEEGVSDGAILVPQRGVTRDPAGNAMVMVVGAGEVVEARVIQTDRAVGDNWLVSAGLKAGDRVILEGIQRARPGTPVRTVPFSGAAQAAPAGGSPSAAAEK